MIQLLAKDLRIQKKFIIAGFFIIGVLFFALGAFEGVPVALPAAIFSHFLIVVASKMDERNNNGRLLASFPLLRRDIVASKYLGMGMFMGIAFLSTFLWRVMAQTIVSAEKLPWYDMKSTIIVIVILFVFYSVYFPLFFALGSRIGQFLDIIVAFSIAGVVIILLSLFQGMNANIIVQLKQIFTMDSLAVQIGILSGSITLLLLSWCLSVYMYNRRNL